MQMQRTKVYFLLGIWSTATGLFGIFLFIFARGYARIESNITVPFIHRDYSAAGQIILDAWCLVLLLHLFSIVPLVVFAITSRACRLWLGVLCLAITVGFLVAANIFLARTETLGRDGHAVVGEIPSSDPNLFDDAARKLVAKGFIVCSPVRKDSDTTLIIIPRRTNDATHARECLKQAGILSEETKSSRHKFPMRK